MVEPETNAFLSHLAIAGRVSAPTRHQPLTLPLFLYRHVIERGVEALTELARARRPQRLPVVLTREEVRAVLARLSGAPWLMASLLCGWGLRLAKCLSPRVQCMDFERRTLLVRGGKDAAVRVTMLPASLVKALEQHPWHVQAVPAGDPKDGWGGMCCQMRWCGSARTRRERGGGSGSFRRPSAGETRRPGCRAGATWMSRFFERRSTGQSPNPGWSSARRATVSRTRLRRISWRQATTSASYRNSRGIVTRGRRSPARTC